MARPMVEVMAIRKAEETARPTVEVERRPPHPATAPSITTRWGDGEDDGSCSGECPAQLAQAEAREEEEEEEVARLALQDARPCEMKLAAGAHEEVELRVERPNTNLYVSVDMVKGRDVDFGIVLLSDDSDGQTPINLFGPCRRATNLSANVLVPSAGTVVVSTCLHTLLPVFLTRCAAPALYVVSAARL